MNAWPHHNGAINHKWSKFPNMRTQSQREKLLHALIGIIKKHIVDSLSCSIKNTEFAHEHVM